jgi:hypothetical protein
MWGVGKNFFETSMRCGTVIQPSTKRLQRTARFCSEHHFISVFPSEFDHPSR